MPLTNEQKISQKEWRLKNSEYDKARKKAWKEANRNHVKNYMADYYRNNSERKRDLDLQRKFGITLEVFRQMWNDQNGQCKLCNEPMLPKGNKNKSVHVDHDHVSGKVRGLLHADCNKRLGFIEDLSFVRLALKYLDKEEEI